jgi:hypothetical protein
MKPAMLRFTSGMLFLLTGIGYAQNAGQPAPKSQPVYRLTMTECEGIDNCTTWMFLSSNGWKGYGKWRTGEEAVLEIKGLAEDQITILRTDVTGSKAGLTATYEGTLGDAQLGGKYKFSYRGESGYGYWYALIGAPTLSPPAEFHFCAMFCNTWRLENGRYVNTTSCGNFGAAGASVITIEKFTRESVILDRSDYPPNGPYTARYTGQISSDGNSLINGAINGTPAPFTLTWGTALNSIPGCGNGNGHSVPSQVGDDPITSFVRDVTVGVAKDMIIDWIKDNLRKNQ